MKPTRQDLISRSEVRKMIEERITDLLPKTSFGTNIRDSFKNDVLQELLSELDNLSGVSGWIPVTERLPDNYSTVIVYDGQTVFPSDYEDGFFRAVDHYSHRYFSIVEWMPLPPHP